VIRFPHHSSGKGLREECVSQRFQMKTKLNLLAKLITANCLIILLMTVAEVWLTRYLRSVPDAILMVFGGLSGASITALACYLILRNYLQHLLEFRKAIESVHEGTPPSVLAQAVSDPTIDGVILSVRDALSRLEDESLWHTTQLLNSIEAERQRIGRELHDQTSQTLATALINLKLADSCLSSNASDARKKLARAKQLIEHSMEQIKICVYDLRPVMLDDLGLVPTLRWHIKTHLTGTGLTIAADFEDAVERAPLNIETTLYRIAQEALANVIRHAQATRVSIRLETKPEYTVLSITDNGKGFNLDQVIHNGKKNWGSGLGLFTIRERIKLAKGTFNIESEEGKGTQISIVIPIPAPKSLENQRQQL
jgi:two-component system, NarL family, sensor histidine kinase UhpB